MELTVLMDCGKSYVLNMTFREFRAKVYGDEYQTWENGRLVNSLLIFYTKDNKEVFINPYHISSVETKHT